MDYKYRLNETMGKSWKIKLMINDIFNTARKNHFTLYSGVREFEIQKLSNTRSVECTLRYNYYMQHSVLIKTATIYNYNFQNYNYKIIFFNKNFFVP